MQLYSFCNVIATVTAYVHNVYNNTDYVLNVHNTAYVRNVHNTAYVRNV